MVHPKLHDNPAAKSSEIGRITTIDLSEDFIRLKLDDGCSGLYATNALLVFEPSKHIYIGLKQNILQLDARKFKDLKA